MVRAIVLAAGASSRMGRPKAALPLDARGDTFLGRLTRTLVSAGIPDVVVVTGAHGDVAERGWFTRDRRVRIVRNTRWQAGQLSSLLTGLDVVSRVPIEAVVVALADVPLVAPHSVEQLVAAWRATRAPVVRPARGNQHGHPVIFDRAVFDELRRADPATGAKPVVRAHAGAILDVAVDDPGAYRDFDTPEDYARLTR